jgi:hypothetical protein
MNESKGSLRYYGSIVVQPRCIDRAIEALGKFAQPVQAKISRPQAIVDTPSDATFVNSSENSNAYPMKEIVLYSQREAAEVTCVYSHEDPCFSLHWKNVSKEEEQSIQKLFTAEIKNMKSFYAPIYTFLVWCGTNIGAVMGLVFVAIILYLIVPRLLQTKPTLDKKVEQPKVEGAPPVHTPSPPKEPRVREPLVTTLRKIDYMPIITFVVQAFLGLIVILGLWFILIYLFPRTIFSIREGQDRYNMLIILRCCVVGFIPMSAILAWIFNRLYS